LLVLGWWCLCPALAGVAQISPAPPPHGSVIPLARIPRVIRLPKFDDFLNNQRREAELAVDSFRQYIPGDGSSATEKTTAYLCYDDKNLYVVFVCHDNSGLFPGKAVVSNGDFVISSGLSRNDLVIRAKGRAPAWPAAEEPQLARSVLSPNIASIAPLNLCPPLSLA
jgi:hypothetical protein